MADFFTLPVLFGIIAGGVRLATPYLYAAIGETFVQSSGVYNLGVEGIMLMGAYSGFFVAMKTGSLELGLLAAALTGILMGLIMAVVSVTLQAEQGISGIGLSLFGLGLSSLLFEKTLGTPQSINVFPAIHIPLLGRIPGLGDIFNQNILVYAAFLLVPVAAFILYRTTFGLKVRAAGQKPEAADTLGVSVKTIRYQTLCIGGMMAGIAGASLSIGLIGLFQENMTSGIGYIAVALVYFGGWRPVGVLGGAMLFSLVNSLQSWIQVRGIAVPPNLATMMPYILTIVALAFTVRRARQPAALGKPFERGEN
ncbi:MAG TPA: ABC transporter permease [Anaerolineaceae bacterium]